MVESSGHDRYRREKERQSDSSGFLSEFLELYVQNAGSDDNIRPLKWEKMSSKVVTIGVCLA